jgi:hypothetical protein
VQVSLHLGRYCAWQHTSKMFEGYTKRFLNRVKIWSASLVSAQEPVPAMFPAWTIAPDALATPQRRPPKRQIVHGP